MTRLNAAKMWLTCAAHNGMQPLSFYRTSWCYTGRMCCVDYDPFEDKCLGLSQRFAGRSSMFTKPGVPFVVPLPVVYVLSVACFLL